MQEKPFQPSSFTDPHPLAGSTRQQVVSLEAILERLDAEAAERVAASARSRASERSQRRMAIFANVMAAIAAAMATIAAIPLIVQWFR